ncbi:uncharacterized protein [Phaseolus vulgaris]|uniref:uncharacterized protein n=1 Tax=Phaseolus vulgaris TaxID=3885 RepID=UPI0035CC0F78
MQDHDQVQKPIYFVNKVLQGPEERYQAIEKAALAVVFTTRTLRHYFHNFAVIVMTDLPIRKVLQKPDIAGRMVRWSVELSEFDIHYVPRGPIKGQVYADFMVELMSGGPHPNPSGFRWILSVDGSSNQQGSGSGAEYEVLIAGMLLPQELGAQNLLVKSDSLLVIEQVTGIYQAKDPQLAAYLKYAMLLKEAFIEFELVHVPGE